MRPPPIAAVGVVVPTHNEEATLAACLQSIHEAADGISVPTVIIVVADGCTDASVAIANGSARTVVTGTGGGNVGVARRTGMAVARAALPTRADRLWLATTDADSAVPGDWLAHQVDLADAGIDAHVGTIALADDGIDLPSRRRFDVRYRSWASIASSPVHPHVHGANLGVRASAYLDAGGFAPRPAHEDRQLVYRLDRTAGVAVLRSEELPVITSARTAGRAPAGVAHDLRQAAHP